MLGKIKVTMEQDALLNFWGFGSFVMQGCNWRVGKVGNSPPRFWQNGRHQQMQHAALLLAHSAFGSQLHPCQVHKVGQVGWAIAHPDFGIARQPQLQHYYLPTHKYISKKNSELKINLWPQYLHWNVNPKNFPHSVHTGYLIAKCQI